MLKRILPVFVVAMCVIGLAFGAKKKIMGDDEKPGQLTISVRDFCDPMTFNAVLGAGVCVRSDDVSVNGSEKFAGFNAELGLEKNVGAWRFNPNQLGAEEGVNLMLTNRGGETHTFTRVAEFGGGFVAPLNAAGGNLAPRPECARMVNGKLAPQPPSANNIFIMPGQTLAGPRLIEDERAKFQCCIHPWMHFTVNGEEDERRGRH